MNTMSAKTSKKYLIFIDILGFQNLADNISNITRLNSAYVRENFMIKPLSQKIDNLMDTEDKHYSFTDDHFVVTDSIDKVFKIIKETSNILLPLQDPIYVPVEIAVDKQSISDNFDFVNQNETIKFLKSEILGNYSSDNEIFKNKPPLIPLQVENVFDLGYMGVQTGQSPQIVQPLFLYTLSG